MFLSGCETVNPHQMMSQKPQEKIGAREPMHAQEYVPEKP